MGTEFLPEVGTQAPDFTLPTDGGEKVSLRDLRGKRVVLYFYPKDDTPGCTKESCAFRDNLKVLEGKGAVVLGVSLDDEDSHRRFREKYNLPFTLLCDVDAGVSKAYGVYQQKNLYGNIFWGIVRTTFIVDEQGKISRVFPRVKVDGHVEEVLSALS